MKSQLRAHSVRWILFAFVGFVCLTCRTGWTQATPNEETAAPARLGTHGGALDEPVVSVDRDQVQVADPFQLVVAVNVAEGTAVQFPALPESLGPFSVLSHRDFFDVPIKEGRSWTRVVELETFESGKLQIPAFSLVIGGQTKTTSSLPMTVESLLEPTSKLTEFRDMKDAEDIPVESSLWKSILAGTLVLLAIIGISWFALSRYQRSQNHENWARKQLDALTLSLAFQQKDQTVILPAAADILRGYIQRKFNVAATQQTTEEFLKRIQFDPILEVDQKDDLKRFLHHVDKIKFAHLVPEDDQLPQTVTLVRTFVGRCAETKQESANRGPKVILAETVEPEGSAGSARQAIANASAEDRYKPKSPNQEGDAGNVVAR